MARLKDILQQQRKKNFVGRQKELEFFTKAIKQDPPVHHLFYMSGPGGQGKTTLLKQWVDECKASAIPFIFLDGRYIDPNPEVFCQVFAQSSPWPDDPVSGIEEHKGPVVLIIDSYEKLNPLDDWLRMEFLPDLPENIITVLSGRNPISTNWKTDPGWQTIIKTFSLPELNAEESSQFLARRNIPEQHIKRIVEYTHGNPLALSIVADMFDQRTDQGFDPMDSPDMMKTLLEQFVQEVPSPAHKAALELCSLVNVTTEKMIEEVLGAQLAHELFNWLTTLTFIEKGPSGIYPHDIVRDVIIVELHWRNPDWYRHLHIKTQQFYIARLLKQTGESQRAILFGLIFLHRANPAVKPFFDFQETGSAWQDKVKEEDRGSLVQMVKKFEGGEASSILEKWMQHEASEIMLFRDAEKTPAGFCLKINLHLLKEKTHDPVVNHLLHYGRHLDFKEGQLGFAFRMWMGRDHYQNVSGLQSAIFLSIVQCYFTPGLASSFLSCAHPYFWKQVLDYADLHHIPELNYDVEGVIHGWYYHDWRERPPLAWLELMGKREVNDPENTAIHRSEGRINENEFGEAVYEALKNIDSPKKLVASSLLKCHFVQRDRDLEAIPINQALVLTDKIKTTVERLGASARDELLHRILYRTFINPVGSQEQTADFLYMSFSTYRRNLKKAVDRVAEILWLEENRPD